MRRRTPRQVGRHLLIACCLGVVALAGFVTASRLSLPVVQAARAAAAVETTLAAVADTYAAADAPSQNYGSSSKIRVDGSPKIRGYLKFDLSPIAGTITKAVLELTTTSSHGVGVEVRDVADTSWSEGGLSYTNAPQVAGTVAARSGAFATGQRLSLDVTSVVQAGGLEAFALTDRGSSTALGLASRETSTKPSLVVTYVDGSGSTTAPPTTTAPPPSTSAPPPSTTTPAGGDPVVAAVGDIACDPTSSSFNGGLGTSSSCRERYVGDLVAAINPAVVLGLGDMQYENGDYSKYLQSYDRSWGRFKAITYPTPGGGHDVNGGGGYYQYFGTNAGPSPSQTWYGIDVGAWRIYSLNANCDRVDCAAEQAWLRADLAGNPRTCVAAIWHYPRWSSGIHGNLTTNSVEIQRNGYVRPFYQILYDAGAELILSGHSHDYERFLPLDPSGARDDARGLVQLVVGTGGKGLNAFLGTMPHSAARQSTFFGVLKLTLHPAGYDWEFVPEPGKSYADAGSGQCH